MSLFFETKVKYYDLKDYAGGEVSETWQISTAALLRAALTVGRQSAFDVMAFGDWSRLEILWRFSQLAANTEFKRKSATAPWHLIPSRAFKALDPSEKSAMSYFLGLTFAKLVAERVCDVAWPMHLDVYSKPGHPYTSPYWPVVMFDERQSRPDLIGLTHDGEWAVLEAKGRIGYSNAKLREDAKTQTQKIDLIDDRKPSWRVASVSQLLDSGLRLDVVDPIEPLPGAKSLNFSLNQYMLGVYRPIVELLRQAPAGVMVASGHPFRSRYLAELDLEVGLASEVYDLLTSPQTESLTKNPSEPGDNLFTSIKNLLSNLRGIATAREMGRSERLSIGPDGIAIHLGPSWEPGERIQLTPPPQPPGLDLNLEPHTVSEDEKSRLAQASEDLMYVRLYDTEPEIEKQYEHLPRLT